ncbi:nucleotidyltransferase family protein [Winslowiella iniecta]|uniref:nucleotidyltransferase family protein n=1 Tax=Winslowiella iniecta TaxID=1560201 RepID=UPI00069E52B0|nr:nucleotidyltransferase domain-containing protein [Winslowiella iniecta]
MIISKYPVKNALVFGSVARGEDTKESDLDIMVDPLDSCSLFHLGGLYEEIVEELGIEISLCTSATMIQRFGKSILNDTIALQKPF